MIYRYDAYEVTKQLTNVRHSPPGRCPNPLDNMKSSVPVDNQGRTASQSQVRRFDVKTFAFMDPNTGHPSVEEVSITSTYFKQMRVSLQTWLCVISPLDVFLLLGGNLQQ